MKTKLITTIIISFLLCLLTSENKAQDGNVINFMRTVPQSNNNNPAAIPSVGFYLGVPALSALNIGLDNGNFSYNNVFTRRADDSIVIDADKFISTLKANNKLSYELSDQIFALGFKVNRSYFTFSINNKNTINANYTKDFMTFLLKGNGPFIGQNANLGDSKLGLNSYIETSLGLTREINERLSVGLKFKYLIGIMNVYTEKSTANLYTDPNTYDLSATSDFLIRTSLPFDSLTAKPKDIKWQDVKNNKGIAFDFGGEYKLTSKLSLGLSVVDLGYIDWSNNIQNYQSKNPNATYSFTGFDINSAFKNGQINDSVFNKIIDSLKNSLGVENVKGSKYRAPLKTKIYFTASYFLTKHDLFGLVIRNDIINQAINTSLTVSYNRYFGKNLSLTFANTVVAGNLLNPGGGFAFNLGFAQFYFLIDHVSSFYAADIKNVGFQFGFNLIAGKSKPGQKSTEPIIKEDEEKKSKRHKLVSEPIQTDSTIVKPPVEILPVKVAPIIKSDTINIKRDSLKSDTLKLLKMQDTILKKTLDSNLLKVKDTLKNVLIPIDTTIKKLTLPIDSVKQVKPLDSIPNKIEGNTPNNQSPGNNPINNDANNKPPAIVPNETTPKQNTK